MSINTNEIRKRCKPVIKSHREYETENAYHVEVELDSMEFVDLVKRDIPAMADEIDRLTAHNAKLVEALKVFADPENWLRSDSPYTGDVWDKLQSGIDKPSKYAAATIEK
jgi:hypothetical protein